MLTKAALSLLLSSQSISLSANENQIPIETAKTQASPQLADEKANLASTPGKPSSGLELMQQSIEMAKLAAEIDRKKQIYGKYPKRKFISASTQDPAHRAYMIAFVRKLEDVGNANYLEEFKRKNITGRVTLTVSIGRDGAVEEVRFNSFSNEKPAVISAIKEAALNIVTASAPFAALPETAEKIDFLHITRTWDFGDVDYKKY